MVNKCLILYVKSFNINQNPSIIIFFWLILQTGTLLIIKILKYLNIFIYGYCIHVFNLYTKYYLFTKQHVRFYKFLLQLFCLNYSYQESKRSCLVYRQLCVITLGPILFFINIFQINTKNSYQIPNQHEDFDS